MGNLIFQTNLLIRGPWLLDETAIRGLDSIIAKHWLQLEERRTKLLEEDVDDEYQKYKEKYHDGDLPLEVKEQLKRYKKYHKIYSESNKRIQIFIDDESSFIYDSFESAFKAIQLVKRNPIAFSVYLRSGDIECKILLDKDDGLKIEVTPEEINESTLLFVELQK